MTALSVGELRESLVYFMDLGGVAGSDLDESREALVRVGDGYWHLYQVVVAFRNGRFVLVLKAGDPDL